MLLVISVSYVCLVVNGYVRAHNVTCYIKQIKELAPLQILSYHMAHISGYFLKSKEDR